MSDVSSPSGSAGSDSDSDSESDSETGSYSSQAAGQMLLVAPEAEAQMPEAEAEVPGPASRPSSWPSSRKLVQKFHHTKVGNVFDGTSSCRRSSRRPSPR